MAPNHQLTYLDRVVMEIIETERMYVRDLRMIVEDYLSHIIDQADLSIRPEQVCCLFGNIEDIYEFNSELLQALDLCDHDPVAVAKCFVMKSEYFEIYTQYCTNYPNSVAALTECMRNKTLAKFFRERQASLNRSLPLGSYLLKPVQRILKYHLLLQEIAKHFDPEEEGYEVVEEAIYTMTGVAWYINDMKRKHEHAVRLQEVQSLLLNWKGHDLTTYGELVLEGTFKVHRAKNERTLFLFDRMLLITKRRGEHYVYKAHITCSTLMLIESAKDSLSFSVTHYKHPKQPHTVQAKTVEEKKLWAHHIKRIILENHHAIIPQKAKDAILERDSRCPPRLRRAPCGQADGRQMRRQSEPSKPGPPGSKAMLKPSMSEDGFLRDTWPPQSTTGGEEEEEAELASSKDSLRRLSFSDDEEEGRLSPDQVADFASSVLAAISCWHVAMVTDTEGASLSSDGCNEENEGPPKEEEPFGNGPTHEQLSTDELSGEKLAEPREEPGEPPSDPEGFSGSSSWISSSEELKSEEDLKPVQEEPSSTNPDSDSKTLSSGESSEDDEGEEAGPEKGGGTPSILPSSVLDKADAIAQHFRRGSLAQDESRLLGCASPRLPSRTGSSLSLTAEPADRRLNSSCSDGTDPFSAPDPNLLEPTLSSPLDDTFDAERATRRRRDSTLSRQDQLLIGKIKSYYEHAGNQDSTFSLQRRESLTHIPTGLVRTSVTRFNSIPDNHNPSCSTSGVSSEPLESLKSDWVDAEDPEGVKPQSVQADEDFRPSSEMIKIWQAMELQITRKQPQEAWVGSKASSTLMRTCPQDNAAPDLQTINEEATRTVAQKQKAGRLRDRQPAFGEELLVLRPAGLHMARSGAEGEEPQEDSSQQDDKQESKVLNLARQYSQRIKTKPVARQRTQGLLIGRTGLACVLEEKESSGKPSLLLPLSSQTLPANFPPSPMDPLRPAASTSPCRTRSRSPLSPPPPAEGFNWPDVQQLRSKYSEPGLSQSGPTGRSRSVPEQMFDGALRRHSSCSSSLGDAASVLNPSSESVGSREERVQRLHRTNSLDPRLSGSQMSQLKKLQEQVASSSGFYVAAEAPLPDDPEHKVIVMEKLPESGSDPAHTTTEEKEQEDTSFVQIRSPTSREKISIMAVIERCRAYQDSEDYKQREDAKVRTEPADQEPDKLPAPSTDQDDGQRSLVRNLREKFLSLS